MSENKTIERQADKALDKIAKATETASVVIAVAAEKAANAVSSAALDAGKLVASQAASAAKIVDTKQGNDHDLLIVLGTKIEGIRSDIQDLKDGTTRRIDTLEKEKLNIADSYPAIYKANVEEKLADHESRIRYNTTKLTIIMTVGSALMVILGIIEWLISNFIKYRI